RAQHSESSAPPRNLPGQSLWRGLPRGQPVFLWSLALKALLESYVCFAVVLSARTTERRASSTLNPLLRWGRAPRTNSLAAARNAFSPAFRPVRSRSAESRLHGL